MVCLFVSEFCVKCMMNELQTIGGGWKDAISFEGTALTIKKDFQQCWGQNTQPLGERIGSWISSDRAKPDSNCG